MRNVALLLLAFAVVVFVFVPGCSRVQVAEEPVVEQPAEQAPPADAAYAAEVPDYPPLTKKELWQVNEEAKSIFEGKLDRKLDELDKFDRESDDEVRLTGFFARERLRRIGRLVTIFPGGGRGFYVDFTGAICQVGVGTEACGVDFSPEGREPERELLTLVSNYGLERAVDYLTEERRMFVKPDPDREPDVGLDVNLTPLRAVTCGISEEEARRMVRAVCALYIIDELNQSSGREWNPLLISPRLVQAHDPAVVERWLKEEEREQEEGIKTWGKDWVEFRQTEIKKLEPELQELQAKKASRWTPDLQARAEQVAKQIAGYRLDLELDQREHQEPTVRERYQMLRP